MNLKKIIYIFCIVPLLSGCTATYNLDISSNNISESLNIYSSSIEKSDYFIPAYYNSISDDEYDVDNNQKVDNVIYYNKKIDSNSINFNYIFTNENFSKTNIANTFYSSFVFKQYDHDEDGKKDYYILSTTEDFSAFDLYSQLTEITIKIKNNHEVISNNADEVDGNVYTWHLAKDNIKAINMVYNPEVIVDNRTLLQKLKDGEFTNIFTISILLFGVGIIVYIIVKRKGDKRNKI